MDAFRSLEGLDTELWSADLCQCPVCAAVFTVAWSRVYGDTLTEVACPGCARTTSRVPSDFVAVELGGDFAAAVERAEAAARRWEVFEGGPAAREC